MTYWFRPKRYGYGATPSNWKGWLATLGVSLVAAVLGVLRKSGDLGPTAWAIAFGAVALLFIWIAWKKTDGAWRWRWGSDDIGK